MISKKYNEQMENYLAKLVQVQTNICVTEKTISNADHIRAMTDEELATWIYMNRWNDIESLLEWLKQESAK